MASALEDCEKTSVERLWDLWHAASGDVWCMINEMMMPKIYIKKNMANNFLVVVVVLVVVL